MTTLTAEKIYGYCEEYCAALRISLTQWRIKMHRQSIENGRDDIAYHADKIEQLVKGTDPRVPQYVVDEGRKYYKIVLHDGQTSVHAFVNKENGDVYKPASWKSPVRDARYNLLDDDAREHLFNSIDAFGSYLYKR